MRSRGKRSRVSANSSDYVLDRARHRRSTVKRDLDGMGEDQELFGELVDLEANNVDS
jgi:hypothetical protein